MDEVRKGRKKKETRGRKRKILLKGKLIQR